MTHQGWLPSELELEGGVVGRDLGGQGGALCVNLVQEGGLCGLEHSQAASQGLIAGNLGLQQAPRRSGHADSRLWGRGNCRARRQRPCLCISQCKSIRCDWQHEVTSWPNMAQPIEIHQATLALLASIALHFCVSLIYSDTRSFHVVASMDWVGSL